MFYKPLVSIIIVTLNREKELLRCLKSINQQTYQNYEVIILDNNSKDNTIKSINKNFSFVKIYKAKKNLGTSYPRNAGVKFSNGDLIWFLDSDVYLKDSSVLNEYVYKYFDNSIADVIGGEGVLDKNQNIIGTKKLKLYKNGMIKGFIDKSDYISSTKIIATCNLLIKKDLFIKVGGFDHFYFFYLEDIDLTYRLSNLTNKIFYVPKCKVVHYFSKSNRFRNFFLANRNRIYFLLKNHSIKKIILLPINDLFYIINFDSLKRVYLKFFTYPKKETFNTNEERRSFKIMNILNSFYISLIVITSMVYSYLYIPYYILNYKKIKNKKNFLDFINKKDFYKI